MPSMLADFAKGATVGVGQAIIDNTRAGKILLDPFMDNTPKQQFKEDQQVYQREMMDNGRESAAFTKESQARSREMWDRQDSDRAIKLETNNVKAHNETSKKNFMSTMERSPAYQNLTDVDKNKFLESPEAKDFIKFQALSRSGINAIANKDPYSMPVFKRMLTENGIGYIEKEGKRFITSPDGGQLMELNDENVTTMMNGLQNKVAQELQTHAAMSEWSNDIMGQSKNDMIKSLSLANDSSYSTAYSDMDKFYKANNFSPQEKRVHYLNKGLKQYFSDGTLDNEEKESVMQQLTFLAKGMGIKHFTDEGGNIYVKGKGGEVQSLKDYSDQLDGLDKVSQRFNEFANSGVGEGGMEFLEGIPQAQQKEASQVLSPLLDDPSISEKDRKNYSLGYHDLLIGSEHVGSPEELRKLAQDIADDYDLPIDKVLKFAPPNVQKVFSDIEAEKEVTKGKNKKSALKLWNGVKEGKGYDPFSAADVLTRR